MLNGTEKVPSLITDYREYHTDTTVRFVVTMTADKLSEAEAAGLHKVFKLQNTLTCNSMVTAHTPAHTANVSVTDDGSSLVAYYKILFYFFLRFCLTTWAA